MLLSVQQNSGTHGSDVQVRFQTCNNTHAHGKHISKRLMNLKHMASTLSGGQKTHTSVVEASSKRVENPAHMEKTLPYVPQYSRTWLTHLQAAHDTHAHGKHTSKWAKTLTPLWFRQVSKRVENLAHL